MSIVGPFKITIEGPNLKEPFVMEFDQLGLTIDYGLTELKISEKYPWANETKSNGQKRMNLKAWSGCPTFESFNHRTEE